MPGGMPMAARSGAGMRVCEEVAGALMRLSTPPRLGRLERKLQGAHETAGVLVAAAHYEAAHRSGSSGVEQAIGGSPVGERGQAGVEHALDSSRFSSVAAS